MPQNKEYLINIVELDFKFKKNIEQNKKKRDKK